GALMGLIPSLGSASDARIVFDRLSLSEGLSQSNVFAFTQDRDGYLWIGTQNAADRFDGHGVWSFRFDPSDPNSLTRGSVTGFHNGPLGDLWITTEFGITRLDAETKEMKRVFEVDPRPSSPLFSMINGIQPFCDDQIISIFSNLAWRIDPASQEVHAVELVGKQSSGRIGSNIQDNNGAMWFSDGTHLWKSACQDHSLRHHSSRASDGTDKDFGQSLLAITPLGHLAWAGDDGLRLIDPASGQQLSTIKPSEYGEASDQVLAINTDHLGGLWLFTREALIRVVLDDSGLAPRQWTKQLNHTIDLELAENRPAMFIETSGDGLIWVSVANVVGVYRPTEQSFQSFNHDPLDETSLPPTVGWAGYDLFADEFGVSWIGSKLGGVARYIPQQHRFTHIRNLTRPAYVVRGIGKQRVNQDQYLWVGLDDGGIELWHAKLNQGFEQTSFVTVDNNHEVDINRMRIRSMATHPVTGEVWFNSVRYLGVADANDRTLTIHSEHPDQFTRNRALAFSPDGRFLYQVIGQNLIQHEFNSAGDWLDTRPLTWLPEKINSFRLGAIHVLNDGTVLVAAEDSFFAVMPWNQSVQAINVLKPQSDPTKTAVPNSDQHRVVSMLARDDGTLWLGTEAAGLFEANIRQTDQGIVLETQRVWSEDNGLPDVTIYAIAQDNLGHVWASSNRGLSRVTPSTSSVLNFGLDDGLQAYEFNTGVVHEARDDSLYFGGINGVSAFKPSTISAHPLPPHVHLEDMYINEKR
ncbi:MAG TPA: two-component regulator propeller domain-containing protein, partial [Wenzhouxiangella sp.]